MTINRKKINKSELLKIYEALLLPRLIEEKMLKLLRQNKISKWFSGIGQEAISVGTGLVAENDDYLLPMHRNLGLFTTRLVPLYPLFCQLFGKADGFTGGRDRSFHFGLPEYNIIGMISHLAATMPIADGIALAMKLKHKKQVAFSFCGDGGTSEGDFHEALNLAAVWKLPVVFIIENNGYGLSTPVSEQYASNQLADRAEGYGLQGIQVDGNDIFAVIDAVSEARKLAAEGRPVMIEALTFRMRGHEEASGTFYVPDELFVEWKEKDPITRLENYLIENDILNNDSIAKIRQNLADSFETDLKQAIEAPGPEFNEEKELQDAGFVQSDIQILQREVSDTVNPEKRFIEGIQTALRQAFAEDEGFVLMGQDIAEYGGVFKVTETFVDQFGRDRIRNTPIIESGIIGTAIGLALEGFKPVVEIQFADFISCGFNQIINNLSKGRYRWMPPLNVTIRAPHGAGVGAGPFHSQSPEGWFMQHPGIRILVPGTVEDAQNMLYTSLYDPNPVLFLEHKKLYRSLKDRTSEQAVITNLDKAIVRKAGEDLTIITYGMGLQWVSEAIDSDDFKNHSIEVVDLRSLAPVDWATIENSVRKTGKVLLLQEPSETLGPMSELSAGITERCFEYLDAPAIRCSSLDLPIPFSQELEKGYLANFRLIEKINKILAY
jgi:2-oxoisovalerate dehydrogenase E1 component